MPPLTLLESVQHSYNLLLDVETTLLDVEVLVCQSNFPWLRQDVYFSIIPATLNDSSILLK